MPTMTQTPQLTLTGTNKLHMHEIIVYSTGGWYASVIVHGILYITVILAQTTIQMTSPDHDTELFHSLPLPV